jgi:hypothetical protein
MQRLAFIQGAASDLIQSELRTFGLKLLGQGLPVAGMTEVMAERSDDTQILQDIASPQQFQIFQDLGKLSQACSLDSTGLSEAAGFVEAQMEKPCALLVVNKFGKEEAERRGFCNVFRKAMLLDIPVLTSVNPNFNPQWQDFSGGLACRIGCTAEAIEHWWQAAKSLS